MLSSNRMTKRGVILSCGYFMKTDKSNQNENRKREIPDPVKRRKYIAAIHAQSSTTADSIFVYRPAVSSS